jgi:23S rRNA pseudouridine1911/1915/1917 synthase
MQLLEKHIVEELENKVRFQEYGVGIFNTIPTKSAIKKAIKKKLIFIDGVAATTAIYFWW